MKDIQDQVYMIGFNHHLGIFNNHITSGFPSKFAYGWGQGTVSSTDKLNLIPNLNLIYMDIGPKEHRFYFIGNWLQHPTNNNNPSLGTEDKLWVDLREYSIQELQKLTDTKENDPNDLTAILSDKYKVNGDGHKIFILEEEELKLIQFSLESKLIYRK